jgi:hypothetical protein
VIEDAPDELKVEGLTLLQRSQPMTIAYDHYLGGVLIKLTEILGKDFKDARKGSGTIV